jgi:hypothetical protein
MANLQFLIFIRRMRRKYTAITDELAVNPGELIIIVPSGGFS